MRTHVLVLVLMTCIGIASCGTTRLNHIVPGMTRTEVAIELGKPIDVRVERNRTLWFYPVSDSKICSVQFAGQTVSQVPIQCDESEPSRNLAGRSSQDLFRMNSEIEYQDRLIRYCGIKPNPHPGCEILPQCTNGGWTEVCPSFGAQMGHH